MRSLVLLTPLAIAMSRVTAAREASFDYACKTNRERPVRGTMRSAAARHGRGIGTRARSVKGIAAWIDR